MAEKDLQARVREIARASGSGKPPVGPTLQGVSKKKVTRVLKQLDRAKPDMIDGVFALLDPRPSWFKKPPKGARLCDGATTAHIEAHVGILQRGGPAKLDREGRDYWIKPLRELGAIEPVYLDPTSRQILPGHLKAKSPNCAYKLNPAFVAILKADEKTWPKLLAAWAKDDAARTRAGMQANRAAAALKRVGVGGHAQLIKDAVDHYVPNFLPNYECLFVDDGDGERITKNDEERLQDVGIVRESADAMPDVLLIDRETDRLWVIEAVTSDGEVDAHKVEQVARLAKRSRKSGVDFTTAYPTWRVAAARQGAHKNIAPGTYVWIAEDPAKQFLAETFSPKSGVRSR